MNARLMELALKKQRLQIRSAALREQWSAQSAGIEGFCAGADRVGEGVTWLRRHPQLLVAGTVALAVARPRAAFRWARRGFLAWRVWRKGLDWLSGRPSFG